MRTHLLWIWRNSFKEIFIWAHTYANCMKLFMKKAHCLLKPCAKELHYIASGSICAALMVSSFSVSPAEPQTEMLLSLCTVFGLYQSYNFTFKQWSSIKISLDHQKFLPKGFMFWNLENFWRDLMFASPKLHIGQIL